jgi:hypothetical protein
MKPQQKKTAPQPELIYVIEIPPGRSLCATDMGQRAPGTGIEPPIGTLKQLIIGHSEQAVLQDFASRLAAEAQAEIDAREREQQAHRDAEQARRDAEPKPCTPIVGRGEALALKRCPGLDIILEGIEPFEFSSDWLSSSALAFGDDTWLPDDTLLFAPAKKAVAWREARESLVLLNRVDPNPRGSQPLKRRFVVVEFSLLDVARRVAYMQQLDMGELYAAILVDDRLQCWFDVSGASAKSQREFFETAVWLHANPDGAKTFFASLPGIELPKPRVDKTALRLKTLGIDCENRMPSRSYLLYWRPARTPKL